MSALAFDQAHEQNNEAVKGRGGAVGRTHDGAQLRRYTIGGPEVQRLLDECRETPLVYDHDHHDCGRSFQMAFWDKYSALKEGFLECGNPFAADSSELYTIDSRVCMGQDGMKALRSIEVTGKSMYDSFVKERLETGSKSVYAKIALPNLKVFHDGSKLLVSVNPVRRMKADAQLFSRLFIACCSRKLNLDIFFQYENQLCPPSISLGGELRPGTKSDLIDILESLVVSTAVPIACEGLILDGAAMMHLLKPRPGVKTFVSYVHDQIRPFLLHAAERMETKRIDIVWDIYSQSSIKDAVRQKRGSGVRRLNLPLKGKYIVK